MNLTRLGVMFAALVQLAGAGVVNWMAVHDSLADVEPWMRRSWLAERGLQDYYKSMSWRPESTGLRCAGRWSYGPSVKVSLRVTANDTIVCLARGSGASLIRFRSQDSLSLDLLSDINCNGIVSRAIIQDTLVFCGMQQGGTGIEVWGVSDLSTPHRLSYVYLPPVMDIAVRDSFLYASAYPQDSLRVFSIADPRNPRWLGACADSGFPICVSGDYCYLADRGGVNIVDVSDPTNPHRVGMAGASGIALSVAVRDTLCFFGVDDNTMRVYNVRNPASPIPVGSLSGVQPADLYLPPTCDTVLYTPVFHAINITDPRNPRIVGQVNCPGWDYGVVAVPGLNYALVADYFDGLVSVDIANPTAPALDTALFAADMAEDISVQGDLAAVAAHASGLILLDVCSPGAPSSLGRYDTTGFLPQMESAVLADSFAYVGWPVERLQTVDITDPTRPMRAGVCQGMFNPPQDMVLRDSFVYCAELRRFQVVNVARPRQPLLAGSCVLPGDSRGVSLLDTLAFVSSTPTQVINVVDPSHPVVVGEFDRGAYSVEIRDTFAYMTGYYAAYVYSVADPTAPRFLDSVSVGQPVNDISFADSLAYFGCQDGMRLMSLADPVHPVVIGFSATPYLVWRTTYAPPYLYAACSEAGICIFETTQTGIAETGITPRRRQIFTARPNPTSGPLRLEADGLPDVPAIVHLRDVTGRLVLVKRTRARGRFLTLDLTPLPPGVYFIGLRTNAVEATVKVCKQ